MSAIIKTDRHGFDGEPPSFSPKRGSEVRDPKTGAIIREGEMSVQNDRVDRLQWLYAHKRIDQVQRDAGRQLQADTEQAQIGGYASLGGTPGGCGSNRLPDAKCDAITRVNGARMAMGTSGWRILELVVIEGTSVEKAESRMRLPFRGGMGALIVALDQLARHYGLA